MDFKKIRSCQIKKSLPTGESVALCHLLYDGERKIRIKVVNDSEDVFEAIDSELSNNLSELDLIQEFENVCLNRFTCYNDFTIEELEANSEKNSFY
ncbi:MAG: hypothetical protein RLY43_1604 [Bacteroidota bacterium]|jgi:hypothetical protein